MKEKIIISHFDASDYLDSEEAITEYLDAINEENPMLLASAMKDVEKARNRMMFHEMTQSSFSGFSHA
jgi:DNA-binding phage protein